MKNFVNILIVLSIVSGIILIGVVGIEYLVVIVIEVGLLIIIRSLIDSNELLQKRVLRLTDTIKELNDEIVKIKK